MPERLADVDEALREYRAYLETLSFIQIDPRLRGQFSLSDLIQVTLLEAFRDLVRIAALPEPDRRRWLRRMLLNNLLDAVKRHRRERSDVSLEDALDGSSCRLADWLAADDTPPGQGLEKAERRERLLRAVAGLPERERETLILQRFHGWKLAEIAAHLGCTAGAVAGLHARAIARLRELLPDEMG